jgi:hypothetical protein
MTEDSERYTANIVDTVIFRSLGKPPNQHIESLKQAVGEIGTELWVSPAIYRELTDASHESPQNPYLDESIADGWVRVAAPFSGERELPYESTNDPVQQAQHLADKYLNQQSKYPETNNWRDASVVALAVRLFEENARIRVITHTADENLARACTRIPPEFGYYDIESRYYNPPQTAKRQFPTVEALSWRGE